MHEQPGPWLRWIDEDGAPLPTGRELAHVERQRADQEAERAERERERAEAAERRIAELEAAARR